MGRRAMDDELGGVGLTQWPAFLTAIQGLPGPPTSALLRLQPGWPTTSLSYLPAARMSTVDPAAAALGSMRADDAGARRRARLGPLCGLWRVRLGWSKACRCSAIRTRSGPCERQSGSAWVQG